MSNDMNCPYCDADCEVCHDDGEGYAEDELHQHECSECGKTFVFTTSVIYYYHPEKADCLNDGNHKWTPTHTYPKECSRMECRDCGEKRQPNKEEWAQILVRKVPE